MAWLYYVDELPGTLCVGDLVAVTGDEAKHAAVVSRIGVGEHISVGDGRGTLVDGEVTSASRDRVEVRAERITRHKEQSPRFHLVQALAKGDRDELAVQAVTELGVAEVTPWQAARSISRWDAKKQVKGQQRWQTIVREAAKQSIRAQAPHVNELATTAQLVARFQERDVLVVVLDPAADTWLDEHVEEYRAASDIALVIGPEGGISPEEIERFREVGALTVQLGSPVLRTSTAGPAAISALSVLTGHWQRPANAPTETPRLEA